MNLQPFRVYVITSSQGLEAVDAASPYRYGAPCVLLVCGNKDEAYSRNGHSTYEMDSCILATHMMLAATNYGVGSVWVEVFDRNVIRDALQIDASLEPVCMLPIGYRAEDCPESSNHLKRKNLNDFVQFV